MPTDIRPRLQVFEEGEEESREILGVPCTRKDPFGFWFVDKPRGQYATLTGAFTDITKVTLAIQNIQNNIPENKRALA